MVVILVVAVALPVTLGLIKQNQDNRQHAATSGKFQPMYPTATPSQKGVLQPMYPTATPKPSNDDSSLCKNWSAYTNTGNTCANYDGYGTPGVFWERKCLDSGSTLVYRECRASSASTPSPTKTTSSTDRTGASRGGTGSADTTGNTRASTGTSVCLVGYCISFSGTVKDNTGAVVSGATVGVAQGSIVKNQGTTNTSGQYQIPAPSGGMQPYTSTTLTIKVLSVPQCYSISSGSSVTNNYANSSSGSKVVNLTVTKLSTGSCAPKPTATATPRVTAIPSGGGTTTSGTALVTLSVFNDTNKNGRKDIGETPFAGRPKVDQITYPPAGPDSAMSAEVVFQMPSTGVYATTVEKSPSHATFKLIVPTGYTLTTNNNPYDGEISSNTLTVAWGLASTATASLTPSVSPTSTTANMTLNMTVTLPGIGGTVSGNNTNPTRTVRTGTVRIYNTNNEEVKNTTTNFNYENGSYKAAVPVDGVAAGTYYIKVKMDNTLLTQLPGVLQLKSGANTLTSVSLIPGDLDQDNVLNMADHSVFVSCYGEKSCAEKTLADFNDDGKVDGKDYNILIRSFAIRSGD